MSETRFTAGEWRPRFGEGISVRAPDGSMLCRITFLTKTGRRDGDEAAANAHLIASAPRLYEAGARSVIEMRSVADFLDAQGFSKQAGELREQMNAQRAALAQARGEQS